MKKIITLLLLTCSISFGHEEYEPFEPDYSELISSLNRLEQSLKDKQTFVAENIPHKNVKKLPIIGEQIVLYHNDTMTWLELENFESIINSEESNNIIVAYIGVHNGQRIDANLVSKKTNVKRKIIPILDPESISVFQSGVIAQFNVDLNLERAIQNGFDALDYHFGATDKLENEECPTQLSFTGLCSLIDKRIKDYERQQINLNRLVTIEEIEENRALNYEAYYLNPIYLRFKRPEGMDYINYTNALHHFKAFDLDSLWWDRDEVNPFSEDGKYEVFDKKRTSI